MKLKGRRILITGGTSGMGLTFAEQFLERGNKVIVCGRNEDKLQAVKAKLPGVKAIKCDVANPDEVQAMYNVIKAEFNGIDILINNAGVFRLYDFQKRNLAFADLEKEIEIDFVAPMRLIDLFLPDLLKTEDAAIVNVESGLSYTPFNLAPIYCAAKAGLHFYSRSLRAQLVGTSVQIFELMPPLVDTEMVANVDLGKKESPENVSKALIEGMEKNRTVIRPGMSSMMYKLSRFMPSKFEKMLNKDNAKIKI